ncbi:MAG: hypothetical protein WC728_04685 [Elusimicrobiota bacterium]
MIRRRDWTVFALLSIAAAAVSFAPALAGRTFFWGDLTYLHHPWRALPAEMLQRGALPLWNPYIYLGMPMAAGMQSAVFYPGSQPFWLSGFATALPLFHWLHYSLCGVFTFLWLRSLGLARWASAAGAFSAMLGGPLVSRIPLLNHLSTLAYFPAMLLFGRRPVLLGLSLALAFLSGYPPMLAGAAAAAWLISRARFRTWVCAGALAAAVSACLLLPAAELMSDSKRGRGIESEEGLKWSFKARDLAQFTAPPLIPRGEYSPAGLWWKTAYAGISVWAAAGLGLRASGAWPLAYLGGVGLLVLGDSNGLSKWLWTHAPPLRYVRYPGNLAYLVVPMLALLVGRGLHRRRFAAGAAALIALELFAYARASQPTAPRSYFTDAGPMVQVLRQELGGHRYLISPLALMWERGLGPTADSASADLRQRLYGLTNMPYHLSSVCNFGEPLVLNASYDWMDFLFTRKGLDDASGWLGWADVRVVMTRDRLKSKRLEYLGDSLWQLYRNPGPASRAFWLDEKTGAELPEGLGGPAPDLSRAKPLSVSRPREDRFSVSGESKEPGWAFVSEPFWRGWKADTGSVFGWQDAVPVPALGAFQKVRVPAGAWSVRWRYDPWSWRLGCGLTVLVLCGLWAYWYNNRLRQL